MRTERRHLVLAAVLLAAAAIAARAPGAIAYDLWQDEVASARILIEPTPWDAVGRVVDTESTPPAWYLAGWLLRWLGLTVEGVRWFSVLCGAVAAGLAFAFARRFLTVGAAALAGTGVALAWQLVARGHELRAYSLYLLISVAFALCLVAAVRRQSRGRLLGLAAVTALGLLTHYFFALVAFTGLLWLLVPRLSNTVLQGRGARGETQSGPGFVRPGLSNILLLGRFWRSRVALGLLAGLVPLLAWLPGFVEQAENGRYSWVANFDALKAAAVYSTYFWSADELYVEADDVSIEPLAAVGRLAILAVILAGAAVLWRRGAEARLVALLATAPVAATTLLWLAGASVFTTRNLICSAPFALIAIAAALEALPRPAALAAGAAALGLLGLGLAQERTLRPPDYERAAAQLWAAGVEPATAVYVIGGAHHLSFLGDPYALRSPIGWYLPGHPQLLRVDPPDCQTGPAVDGRARPIRIVRIRCDDAPPGGYWFEVTLSVGGQASPRLRREPQTTQRVVV